MATVTHRIGAFNNEQVVYQYDYNDGTLFVTAFRCINGSDLPAWGSATDLARNRTYEQTFPANATTEQSIPTGAAQRLDLVISPSGRFDNLSVAMRWPA